MKDTNMSDLSTQDNSHQYNFLKSSVEIDVYAEDFNDCLIFQSKRAICCFLPENQSNLERISVLNLSKLKHIKFHSNIFKTQMKRQMGEQTD